MQPPTDTRQPPPEQLTDAQLAAVLAQAEAEARQAQARADALRSEGWRRRSKLDWNARLPAVFFGALVGYLLSSSLLMLRFGLSPFMLLSLAVVVIPVLTTRLLWRRKFKAAPPEVQQQASRSLQEFWTLARPPALQGFLWGVGVGLLVQWLLMPGPSRF